MAQPAPSGSPVAKPARPAAPSLPLPRRIAFWGFATLVVLAGVFYLWWGLSFGVWLDNGVYAVFITLLLFGLAGMWLVAPAPASSAPPSP
jgi:type VI protein secretion system component VasF